MSVFAKLKALLGKKEIDSSNDVHVPEDFCPNCWGRQEYGGNFYEAVKNEGIDINNIDSRKGWIEAYAAEKLGGIQLKMNSDNVLACPTCKVTYKAV